MSLGRRGTVSNLFVRPLCTVPGVAEGVCALGDSGVSAVRAGARRPSDLLLLELGPLPVRAPFRDSEDSMDSF